ncbi:hypothetical protein ACJQWK_06497 [Exserohilum turcicum]
MQKLAIRRNSSSRPEYCASLVDQAHAARSWKDSGEYPCFSLFETCRALKAAVCFLNSVKSHPAQYWKGCLEVQNREKSDECTAGFGQRGAGLAKQKSNRDTAA